MKKKINIAALALIMVASASAQTIYDGAKFQLWEPILPASVYIVVMI